MMDAHTLIQQVVPVLIAAAVYGLPASAEDSVCPLWLAKEAIGLSAAPGAPTSLTLTSVGMLHGPFDGSGYLKPTVTKVRRVHGKAEFTTTWDFGPPPHYERWYFCEYGEVVELFRKVDDRAESCTIASTREGSAITAMRISCTPAGPQRR